MKAAEQKTSYFMYWGKTNRREGDALRYHLLPFHNLDVAAVGWHLLDPVAPLAVRWAKTLALPADAVRSLLVFSLGIHDIGKFSRAFQGVSRVAGHHDLVPPIARFVYAERHDRLGAMLWDANHARWRREGVLGLADMPINRHQREDLRKGMDALLAPIFGHHGKPVAAGGERIERFFGADEVADDMQAAASFVADWAQVVEPRWPVEKLLDPHWRARLQAQSWLIAGWAVVSDWLGSNEGYFSFETEHHSLADYWQQIALPRAERALANTGLTHRPQAIPFRGLAAWFDHREIEPTPLQNAVEKKELPDGPELFVLEEVTGAGKTEAACILVQRLLAAGAARGLFFALPSMATSNAMYERLGALHRRFFTEESQPSFVLAHGARELNETFNQAIDNGLGKATDHAIDEPSNAALCNRWFADSRKKALLADVGVGTIDQVLMGLLPFRHQSLRLFGLADKVLVVDEVHAYDVYMQKLLETLLEYHASQGGSAILLTATLPLSMRAALIAAWQRGRGAEMIAPVEDHFPLLTAVGDTAAVEELALETPDAARRHVAVEWLTDEEHSVEAIKVVVQRGECVAWVRNTVDDAIRAFEAIRQWHPDPERCLLFHSRFAMADRQAIERAVLERLGKDSSVSTRRAQVLIATQVFQESLDCDVDCLISDLAPVDALIQRAGRLQRHRRGKRTAPTMQIIAPEWQAEPDRDWLKHVLPGTQAVYGDPGLCWLTQRVLRTLGAIVLPRDARLLVESVYGESAEALLPAALEHARYEREGQHAAQRGMGRFNALQLAAGYGHEVERWQEEQEIGTRLTDEPNIQVALLRVVDDALELWAGDSPHTVVLSQMRLRESQAHKLAELPSNLHASWERLQTRYRSLSFAKPWAPPVDTHNQYDPCYGLRFGSEGIGHR